MEDGHLAGTIAQETYQILKSRYDTERKGIENQRNELLTQLTQADADADVAKSIEAIREKLGSKLTRDPLHLGWMYSFKGTELREIIPPNLTVGEWREIFTALRISIIVTTPEERKAAIQKFCDEEAAGPKTMSEYLNDKKFQPRFDVIINANIDKSQLETAVKKLDTQAQSSLNMTYKCHFN